MTNWEGYAAVDRHPDKLSGAWVFHGTRVPVSVLFENLKDGATIEQFLKWFPGVEGWKAAAVLERSVDTTGKGSTCGHRASDGSMQWLR